ncbi:DNA methyltransferase [Mesonia sp.]|uniref:DNA methyltransferase n=1 Tax=Mesonia sp. TaxID=1960830 RepID=UPI003F9C8EAC
MQQEITTVLEQFPSYWDNGILLKNRIIEDVRNYQPELLSALLKNKAVQKAYSLEVDGLHIFKVEDFTSMLRYKNYLENSYTKYSNEIGLTSEGKYLKYNSDVVLDFPHKDGILEGGMTEEDTGKDEVFYHNVLAKEEIDILLSPKVLTNIKKHDKNGEHFITEIEDTDNLIIKGNNLIALHTLKERYTGKVKLIYIDPPYNTGGDSFMYNDRFNHSSWLTFMKNRIEVAKNMLAEDGVMFINIDEGEHSYLKIVCDEIFGRENFVGDIIWKKRKGGGNDSHFIALDHDYILVYLKNNSKLIHDKWKISYEEIYLSRYKEYDEELGLRYYWDTLARNGLKNPIPIEIEAPDGTSVTFNSQKSIETIKEGLKTGKVRFTKTNNGWSMHHRVYQPEGKVLRSMLGEFDTLPTNKNAKDELNILFNKYEIFSNPKPEGLLKKLIEMTTKEGDLVLDFFMGSATTPAVAMKMGRQFIGIEQMNYINDVSVPRLQKVINGEQGGISKEIDWNGGGDFVYVELFELNQVYRESILNASNYQDIEDVITAIKSSDFLNIKVVFEKFLNTQEKFFGLPLERQKDLLSRLLDDNQLYLSYSEIDDDQYAIDDQIKTFNHSFYQEGV